jgi:hypothetical protein
MDFRMICVTQGRCFSLVSGWISLVVAICWAMGTAFIAHHYRASSALTTLAHLVRVG